jgi:hypothetical protein
VTFRVRWAEIDLSEADLSGPTIISFLPIDALRNERPRELPSWTSIADRQAKPRIISLADWWK